MTDAIRKLAEQVARLSDDCPIADANQDECDKYSECWQCVADRAEPILAAALSPLVEALEAVTKAIPPILPPDPDDWWCPTCKTALSGSRVTNGERCDTCGTFLGDINTTKWADELAIAYGKAKTVLAAFPAPAPDDRLQTLLTAAEAMLGETNDCDMVDCKDDGSCDLSAYGKLRVAVDAFKGGGRR